MNKVCFTILFLGLTVISMHKVRAESEVACSIWLCLPGGFPPGCSNAHSEFKDRIKKGKSPLPDLSSCTIGPDGKSSNGSYQLGADYFMPCKEGYAIDQQLLNRIGKAVCEPDTIKCTALQKRRGECGPYDAVRRSDPHYVKMWVEGQYIGQFFY